MAKSKNGIKQESTAISTTLDLEKTGIKAELNQNDVIEVIAQAKYDSLMDEISRINENVKKIYSIKTNFRDEQNELFVKDLITKGLVRKEQKKLIKLSNSSFSYNGTNKLDNYAYGSIHFNDYSKKREIACAPIEFGLLDGNSVLNITYCLIDSYSKKDEKDGIEINTNSKQEIWFSKNVPVPHPIIKNFNQSLIEHCQRVKDFYNQNKGFTEDIDRIVRETRAKFNKELLKAKSPLVKGQIEQLFQVTL